MDKVFEFLSFKKVIYKVDSLKRKPLSNFISTNFKLEVIDGLQTIKFKDNSFRLKENKFLFYIDETKNDLSKIIIYPTKLSIIQIKLLIILLLVNILILFIVGKGSIPFFILLNIGVVITYLYFLSKRNEAIGKFLILIKQFEYKSGG